MRTKGEGGLLKIGDTWYFSFYDLNGKQVRRSSKSPLKSVALTMLQAAQEELRKGTTPTSVHKLRYEDLRQILLNDYIESEKLTMDGDDIVISGKKGLLNALDAFFGGMSAQAITTDVIRKFIAKRKAEGITGPSINRNLARLRRMFKLAQREGKISSMPYFPMGKESEPREGFVEREQFEMLRAAMPTRLHPALTFCYETGCRTGAMKQIVWSWVSLDKAEMNLPAGIIKNRKPLTLTLTAELVGMLGKLFRREGPVFDITNFRREWITACVKVGLGKKTGKGWYAYEGLNPHDFRRSAVKNLTDAGVDQATAMKITGHKTVAVFLRYNIVPTEKLHEASDKVVKFHAEKKTGSIKAISKQKTVAGKEQLA
jgi:integrase